MRIFTPAGERRRWQAELKAEKAKRLRLARMQAQYEREQAAKKKPTDRKDG